MPKFILKQADKYPNLNLLSSHSCTKMFTNFEIDFYGDVRICCNTWMPQKVGNLIEQTAEEIVDSPIIKDMMADMRLGKFSYCNDLCPTLSDFLHNKKQFYIIPAQELAERIDFHPLVVNFCYDPSCNLQCPSCRNEMLMADPDNPTDPREIQIMAVHEKVKKLVDILLSTGRNVTLSITGSGDPFAGIIYWRYLKELAAKPVPSNLRINLVTNGTLMTRKKLLEIKTLWPHIVGAAVSIDAATEETYKIVRKNGSFNNLKKNLLAFDKLISEGAFPQWLGWQTNFIVQKDNFKELKAFVEWQLTYVSKPVIWLHLIAQWYHIPDSQYKVMAIHLDGNNFKNELIEIIKDPVFSNTQVRMGNLNSIT